MSRDLKRAAYEEELWINHIDRAKAAVCEGFLGSNATDEDRNRVGVTAAAFSTSQSSSVHGRDAVCGGPSKTSAPRFRAN